MSHGQGQVNKLCDATCDAILDAYLALDPYSRVACEALCKWNSPS
jgi:S-adenosylmethionine synthetase